MMPPHKQKLKRSAIWSLIAAGALVLYSVVQSFGQLTVIDFSNGTPGGSSGLALEDTLRNSQRAVLNNIIAAHNGSWLQRSNDHLSLFLQQSNSAFRLANIEYYQENIFDTLGNVLSQAGVIKENTMQATNFLALIRTNLVGLHFWAETNFLQDLVRDAHLDAINEQLELVQESFHYTTSLLTNVDRRLLASTNIQTGVSNLTATAANTASGMSNLVVSMTNLLTQATNRLQVQINMDGAMSNLLYQINNAGSWHSYVAENTKQTTNFLAHVTQGLKALTNQMVTSHSISMSQSNLAWLTLTNDVRRHNTALGASNLLNLTYQEILAQTALLRDATNYQAQAAWHLGVMRSNLFSVTLTNQLVSISNSLLVVSNTAAATAAGAAAVTAPQLGDLYDVSGTNWTAEKSLSNQLHRGELILSQKQAALSNAHKKFAVTVAQAQATGKPAGFLLVQAGGRTFNFDARDHAKWSTPVSRMRDFVGWVIVLTLFVAVWQEARTAAFVTQLTPQMKVPQLQILGNDFGPFAYILWLPVLCAALIAAPIAVLNIVSSDSFFTTFLDFSGGSGGVVTNPFDGLATAVQGIYYFVDTYIPVPTLIGAGVSYMASTAQISAITAIGGLAIRAIFS